MSDLYRNFVGWNDLTKWVDMGYGAFYNSYTDVSGSIDIFDLEGLKGVGTRISLKNAARISQDKIEIDVPGYGAEDFEISVVADLISIESTNKKLSFSFQIKNDVEKNSIEATVEKGILTISLPQKPRDVRKIVVK